MAISKSVVIGFAAGLVAGAAAGVATGSYLGFRLVLNNWVQEQAGDVRGHIALLRELRTGKPGEAIEMLEIMLDDDLVVLEPEGYQLQPGVREDMYAALRDAKQYRSEYPRKSRRSAVDEMVRNVLSREIPATAK